MGYLQQVPQKLRLWVARQVLSRAKQAHVWAAVQLINDPTSGIYDEDRDPANPVLNMLPDHMMWAAKAVMESELDQVVVTGRLKAFNQITEEAIIHQRLARRYDPGMAMNEAFDRAARKVASVKPGEMVKVDLRPGETIAQAQQRVLGGDANQPILRDMRSLELSPKQQMALKVQEEFLRKNAATSSRLLGT